MTEATVLEKKQSPVLGISSTLLTQIFSLGLNLFFSIIFTRILGPEGRGVLVVFVAGAAIIVYLGSFGFPTTNAYFGAQNEGNVSKLLTNSFVLCLIYTVFIISALLFFPQFQSVFGIEPKYYQMGFWFLAVNSPLTFLSQLVRDLLLAKHWFVQYNLSNLSSVIAYGILGLVLSSILKDKLFAILMANALSTIFPVVITLWFLIPSTKWSLSWELLQKSIKIGWRVYLINLIILILARLNILMISHQLGSKSTGLYSVALSLSELIINLPYAAVPVIFAFTAYNERQGIRLAMRTNRLVMVIVFFINITMAIFAIPILSIFGNEFKQARLVLLYLLPGVQLYSTVLVLRSYFQGKGYPITTILIFISGLLVHFLLNTLFIPRFGMNGAAISLSIAYLWMMVGSTIYIKTCESDISWSNMFLINKDEFSNYFAYVKFWTKRLLKLA